MPPSRQEQFDALTTAISRVLTPVMICMALSVWFVHSLGDPNSCEKSSTRKLGDIPLYPPDKNETPTDTSGPEYSTILAAIFVGIFAVLLVIFTFLLVWLYKSGRTRIIVGWLMCSVFLIFAYVGGLYVFDFCRSRCVNLDWITLAVAVWNFTITGLLAVFAMVPRIVNQAFLIIMSALMAYIFRSLPDWAIWTILGALVLWDLFAVLSPHGPLRKLVDAARERGDPLPALVYDTNPQDVGRDESSQPTATIPRVKRGRSASPSSADTIAPDRAESETPAELPGEDESAQQHRFRKFRRKKKEQARAAVATDDDDATVPPEQTTASEQTQQSDTAAAATAATAAGNEENEIRVGTLGTHLKLGLGDFVFYSILVSQASKSGAMTTITSFVAILAGLCATLFLVIVYKKALPALPISIVAGLIFYFLTRYTVQPLVEAILPELLVF